MVFYNTYSLYLILYFYELYYIVCDCYFYHTLYYNMYIMRGSHGFAAVSRSKHCKLKYLYIVSLTLVIVYEILVDITYSDGRNKWVDIIYIIWYDR